MHLMTMYNGSLWPCFVFNEEALINSLYTTSPDKVIEHGGASTKE